MITHNHRQPNLQQTLLLHKAVHSTVVYDEAVTDRQARGQFQGVGILDYVGYATDEPDSPEPLLILYQLWCFHQIDPDGRWLDAAELQLAELPDGKHRIHLTEDASSVTERPWATKFLPLAQKSGWVRVVRAAIAPALGIGHPTYKTLDGREFEVLGIGDEHVVPVRVVETTE